MNEIILLKLGEVVLKGQNRPFFEKRLIANVRRRLAGLGKFNVYCAQSTVYVEPEEAAADMARAFAALETVFGVVSLSRAAACEKDKDAIWKTARDYLAGDFKAAHSFKVETKRADKRFPMTSIQLSQYVGGLLHEAFPDTAVDVHNPALTVHIEVRDFAAYVHGAPVQGAGGMPVGVNGRAVSLLSGGIDSPVSTYMIAKRGVSIIPVHFFSFPYTSELAKEKVVALTKKLTKYCGSLNLEVVPFTRIQEEMRKSCPEALFTILMRRFMMRIAEEIAIQNGCGALVTGESLGQVASQTMEAMASTEEPIRLPVLRPLVGMDKEEIVAIARKIDTFETSILPYEDCCTVFTPRHPSTKPKPDKVHLAEAALDIPGLVQDALNGIEQIRVS